MISSLEQASAAKPTLAPALLAGLVVEVHDLAATRAFYEPVFGDAGEWQAGPGQLVFQTSRQRIDFVARAKPRTLSHTGQHQAYAVPANRLAALTGELAAAGHAVDRWREDHPDEREVSAYLLDPSGNRVQLVPDRGDGLLLNHAAVEVHDLELAEIFYVSFLGGSVDYCHGWAMDDYAEAFAWGEGSDPCAPWTRRYDVRYWDKVRIARPNMQLFVRFGPTVLAIILATEHRQEPPPEQHSGTPRIILAVDQPAAPARAELSRLGVAFDGAGSSLFVRDLSGNFVELACAS